MKTIALSTLVLVVAASALAGTPPVAVDDAVSTPGGTPVSIDVLANDSDEDGSALAVAVVGHNCPATVTALFDGTLVLRPQAVGSNVSCAIDYSLSDGRDSDTARVAVTLTPGGGPPPIPQTPYGGTAFALPGRLEAERYDEGGEGVAYHDSTPGNQANEPFRPSEAVDAGVYAGVLGVQRIEPGEWLEYTANVAAAGRYQLEVHYTSMPLGGDAELQLVVSNATTAELTRAIVLPERSVGSYGTHLVQGLDLLAGAKVLRLAFTSANVAIDALSFAVEVQPACTTPPVANPDVFDVPRGEPFTIPRTQLLANDSPPGALVTDFSQQTQPTRGTLVPTATAFVYTPGSNFTQADHFYYRARCVDDPTRYSGARVTLVPAAPRPVANPDSFRMPPGSSLEVSLNQLLANDVGDHRTFHARTAGPSRGTWTLTQSGQSFVYTPSFSSGIDTFDYTISDASGLVSLPATVTLEVTASGGAPVANPDAFRMAQQATSGEPAKLTVDHSAVFANDVRVNQGVMLLHDFTPASAGSVFEVFLRWDFIPPAGFEGTSTWQYRVAENGVPSNWAEVRVGVFPAPTAVADSFTTGHDTPLAISIAGELLANDLGRGLALALAPGSLGQPTRGSFDLSDPQTIVYLPEPGFSGTVSFTYRAANELHGVNSSWKTSSEPATVTITVEPPDAVAVADRVIVPEGVGSLFLPFERLFANDSPPSELTLVGVTRPIAGNLVVLSDGLRYTPKLPAGPDRFTYTVRRIDGNPHVTATATVEIEAEPSCVLLMADAFETGDLSRWTRVVANGGTVAPSPAAAIVGPAGLGVTLQPGAQSVYVEDSTAARQTHLATSFWLDLRSLSLPVGGGFQLLNSGGPLALRLENRAGRPSVFLQSKTDAGTMVSTPWSPVDGGPHLVRLDWRAASGPGRPDGFARLWVDNLLVGETKGLDNDEVRPLRINLGALFGIPATTTGTFALDEYRSCQGPLARQVLLDDDFESGTLDRWTGVVEQAGQVAASASSPLAGTYSLRVDLTSRTQLSAHAYDDGPNQERHLFASFKLDASGLEMVEGESFILYGGSRPGVWVTSVRLGMVGGQRSVRLVSSKDDLGTVASPWVPLPTGSSNLTLEWWAAKAPGANDGGHRLFLGGVMVGEASGLDNDQQSFDRQAIGAVAALDPGTTGVIKIDNFEAWR